MMNALFNKIFFRLRIIYDNFLKLSKTLKKIKTYFICVNNRHKMTRKIRKKEKIQKINRVVRSHILKRFVLFFSRSIYTSQLLIFLRHIINYCKQKNVDENVYFNCHEQDYIATNCSKFAKRLTYAKHKGMNNGLIESYLADCRIFMTINSDQILNGLFQTIYCNILLTFKRKSYAFMTVEND